MYHPSNLLIPLKSYFFKYSICNWFACLINCVLLYKLLIKCNSFLGCIPCFVTFWNICLTVTRLYWYCQALSSLLGFIGITRLQRHYQALSALHTKLYRHYQALLTAPSFIDINQAFCHYQALSALSRFIGIIRVYWHYQNSLTSPGFIGITRLYWSY